MNRYLEALEIIPFDIRGAERNLVDLNCYDLLIVSMRPQNQQLEQLFYKISESIKLINTEVTYQTVFLDGDSDDCLEQITQQSNFSNLVVFGTVQAVLALIASGQFTADQILQCANLNKLQSDANQKKHLWSELKAFLSR